MSASYWQCKSPGRTPFWLNECEVHLRQCFRSLWEQHVYWTRATIISITMDLPDLAATTNRLLRNAADFARLFRCFYGERYAAELNRLLRDHILIAGELVTAVKDGKAREAAAADKRWHDNGDEIAAFLHHSNPFWKREPMRAMWYEHLALLKQATTARLSEDYVKEIALFDRVEKQALLMADEFARSIICQFGL